ncbi:SAM-dependent methyltransferase [Actinoplanes subtropicus]|uniref:SAM-dependent methyltransferase n=1 Tax=Actinoplanes subtropicus TaxID=543632 RepID=UPI0009FDC088|nr:SAM-dependent methyltransferase [Actinoplanes subtropicus]
MQDVAIGIDARLAGSHQGATSVRDPLDESVPNAARRYDHWLGGKDNFAADRTSGEEVRKRWPGIVTAVRENRLFLGRAVRYAAKERGIRQFLDIGTGMPAVENTHEVAQQIAPEARVVYVDNDPLVLVHARALLTSRPEGQTAYVEADLRDPDRILEHARQTLDLGRPVALMLLAVLHFLPDLDQAYKVVRRLTAELAPGSLLVLSHGSYDLIPPDIAWRLTHETYPGRDDFFPRTGDEVSRFFEGWELLDLDDTGSDGGTRLPGIISDWGPGLRTSNEVIPGPREVSMWGGVARKPS